MDWTKHGLVLVLVCVTLVVAAPPSPHDVTRRTALVGRLGLTMSVHTMTEVATTRNQKPPLERNGDDSETPTPSVNEVPNYRTEADPSSGEIRGYFLIPIPGRTFNNNVNNPDITTNPPNVIIPLTQDGRPLTNPELENLYRNRGILQNIASNITQFFPVFPIEINVPDLINTVTLWFNSIPFINRWQQSQANDPKIYFTPSTLYLKKPYQSNTGKDDVKIPVTSFRDASGYVVGTRFPVQLISRRDVMYVTGLKNSNYFKILNQYLQDYRPKDKDSVRNLRYD